MSEPGRRPAETRVTVQSGDRQTAVVQLSGDWTLGGDRPSADELLESLDPTSFQWVSFDGQDIAAWDSGLLAFLVRVIDHCRERDLDVDPSGLPDGVRRLLDLAYAVPERSGARGPASDRGPLARLGEKALSWWGRLTQTIEFMGEALLAMARLLRGRARFRRVDAMVIVQECGVNALPIVTLISFLVGAILAFVGAVQLQQFGAQIYVANLVGIAVVREMGAMMTGIIMAGRTGAAFAAQIGTMTLNEEVDALKTMGISPIDFLVLPRMLALILMMPLLCLYADLMGILGGAAVGLTVLDLPITQYFVQTRSAIGVSDIAAGMIKCTVFGVLVALAGCQQGMQSGRNASAVGDATTSAVVTGILFIIVSDAILTVVYNTLGF